MARETIEEVLKIVAEIDPAIRSIEQLKQKIADLKRDASKIDMVADPSAYKKLTYEIDRLEAAEKRLATSTRQANEEMRRQNKAVSDTTKASGMANASLLALGYAFSDMGQFGVGFSFGVRAIANNISSLSIALTLLGAEAKASGTTFGKALLGALRGPYGLIVGFQMLVGLIDLWASSQRKAKEESKKLEDQITSMRMSTEKAISKIRGMKAAYDMMNPSSEQAAKMKKAISKELLVNIKNYEDLDDAIRDHVRVLELQYEAEYILSQVTEANTKQWVENQKALKNNKPILLEIEAAQRRLGEAEEGSQEHKAAAHEIEKLRSKLMKITILQDQDVILLNERYAEIQAELNGLLKETGNTTSKIYTLKKEWLNIDKEALELMERTIKAGGKLQEAELRRSALIYNYINGEKTKSEELFDEYQKVVSAINMLNISQSDKERIRLQSDLEYRRKLREIELSDVNKQLKAEEDARQKALERIEQTEQAKMQFASNTVGFLISLNAAMAGASEEERRKAFKRDKALRVAQATIDTYAGANRAFATAPGTPLGFFLAAAVVAAGLANVATIMGQNYDGGVMGNSRFARGVDGGMGQGIQGGYPYPMTGGSTLQPQFPDRTGSLDIRPRTQRLYVLEADITDAQQAQVDRGMKAGVF